MKKILVVEDETLVALEIASALKKEGYLVTDTVESAEESFRAIENDVPDLILMDINIDGPINGIEASRRINTIHDIPVIFLTAYNDKKTIDSAIETFPKAYLIKPFKRQELYAAVSLSLASESNSSSIKKELSKTCFYYPNISELVHIDKVIPLTKKEKQLLDLLLTYKNTLVTFEDIEYELWPEKSISTTTRRTLIYRLREKIGDNKIKTIKDQGCILEI